MTSRLSQKGKSVLSRPKNTSQPPQTGFTIVELLIVVIVIAILATITILSFNSITSRARASAQAADLATMKKKSELRKTEQSITCPDNYVFVYGNTALGTSDFCVMKYQAKIQGNDVGTTTYAAGMVAESRPTGTPWTNISQTNAITEATETGGHLLTEAEWMTIAADVLSVKYNWSGGEVGSGFIYSGHNDNAPANSLAASTDDTDGYSGTGNSANSNSGPGQKRTLYLTSGDTIWDIAGNVHEWTQQAIGTPTLTLSQIGVSGDAAFNQRQWTLGSLNLGNLPAVSRPSAIANSSNPITGTSLTGVTSWASANGIGRINANYADTAARAFVRGGYWNYATSAGVLTLSLSYAPSGISTSVGFRVAR